MITREQALDTNITTFYHATLRNADNTPLRVRRNGKCQTWKTRLLEFKLPVKYGLKECFYITHLGADGWCATEEEAKSGVKP